MLSWKKERLSSKARIAGNVRLTLLVSGNMVAHAARSQSRGLEGWQGNLLRWVWPAVMDRDSVQGSFSPAQAASTGTTGIRFTDNALCWICRGGMTRSASDFKGSRGGLWDGYSWFGSLRLRSEEIKSTIFDYKKFSDRRWWRNIKEIKFLHYLTTYGYRR